MPDPGVPVAPILDADRILVAPDDGPGNIVRIRALLAAPDEGPFRIQPFAAEVRALDDVTPVPESDLAHVRASF